ncbi:helix-turn-helix domain-containing protein [Clostridium beijerinckii]|uniref:helix-turn-helix domain-containing protein n=1 Tax=Clostridium beijerinckii TaxID=1520 RepID=UPI00242A4D7A|nr:helix-turn-helix transcriptional regulator [Clostridium beijerinckii]MDG5852456.1 helix-turn-helix transcriptional regulator [Clostridium beijerinckii]
MNTNMFGNYIRERRENLDLSLRDAAKLIGISHSYLSTLEKGIDKRKNTEVKPTPEILRYISDAYKINYTYLMELVGYIPSNDSASNTLNDKDKKDIQKDLKNIMDDFKEQTDGTKYYNGIELKDEDFDLIETAMNVALEQIKIKNKKKYTPNKFKK